MECINTVCTVHQLAYGTQLFTIRTDDEAVALFEDLIAIGTGSAYYTWVGLNDRDTEGDWVWTSGWPWYVINAKCRNLGMTTLAIFCSHR